MRSSAPGTKSASMPEAQVRLLRARTRSTRPGRRWRSAPSRGAARSRASGGSGRCVRRPRALRCPRSVGGGAVALGVRRGVGLGCERLGAVQAQVEVVVGQHVRVRFKQDSPGRPPRPAISVSAIIRSAGVVTFRFSCCAGTTITLPPARSISQASSVACASSCGDDVQGPRERRAPEHLRRLHRPQRAAVERLDDGPGGVDALDRVGDGRGGDRRVGAGVGVERRDRALEQVHADERAGGVVDEHRLALAGGRERQRDRLRAARASGHRRDALGRLRARRHRDDDLIQVREPGDRVDAPGQQRAPRQLDERLGPAGPQALAAAGGDDQCDDHGRRGFRARGGRACARCRVRESLATWLQPPLAAGWPSRRAARRGSSRPLPRPCRARTSARRRGSSWCG